MAKIARITNVAGDPNLAQRTRQIHEILLFTRPILVMGERVLEASLIT